MTDKQETEWKELKGASNWWKPENEGDEVTGILVSKSNDTYVLEINPGDTINLPNHSWLVPRIEEAKVGQLVRVVYVGKEKTNTGREAFSYKVFVKNEEGKTL